MRKYLTIADIADGPMENVLGTVRLKGKCAQFIFYLFSIFVFMMLY